MAQRKATYKERAIVLHTTKYGDKRLIIHTITEHHGRCSYITTIGRNTTRALFQPLYLIDFMASSPSSDDGLHTMREATLCGAFSTFRSEPTKALIVMMLSELLYRVVRLSDDTIFRYVVQELERLDAISSATQVANFHLQFMVGLTSLLGYAPNSNYQSGMYFDIKEGCYTPTEPKHPLYLRQELASVLHTFSTQRRSMDQACEEIDSLALNGALRKEFLYAMVDYYGYHDQAVYSVRSIEILADVLC